jgi:hypothetical protein
MVGHTSCNPSTWEAWDSKVKANLGYIDPVSKRKKEKKKMRKGRRREEKERNAVDFRKF